MVKGYMTSNEQRLKASHLATKNLEVVVRNMEVQLGQISNLLFGRP